MPRSIKEFKYSTDESIEVSAKSLSFHIDMKDLDPVTNAIINKYDLQFIKQPELEDIFYAGTVGNNKCFLIIKTNFNQITLRLRIYEEMM